MRLLRSGKMQDVNRLLIDRSFLRWKSLLSAFWQLILQSQPWRFSSSVHATRVDGPCRRAVNMARRHGYLFTTSEGGLW